MVGLLSLLWSPKEKIIERYNPFQSIEKLWILGHKFTNNIS